MTRKTAYQSYSFMMDTVTRARKTYELYATSSIAIHSFSNKYQTAWSAVQTVKVILDNEQSTNECVELAITKARKQINELLMFVGTNVRYYSVKDEVGVSESEW